MPTTTLALIGLGLILTAATLLWSVTVRRRDASLADIAWGPGFALLAWTYIALDGRATPRALGLAIAVSVWAGRLAWHIARRHRGEDRRYQALRQAAGPGFWWQSLFTVCWLQGTLLWVVAMPLLAVARTAGGPMTVLDAVGSALLIAGAVTEAVADAQLTRFRRTASSGDVLDAGLWRYSRHPNYFGDALFWWGVWLIAIGAGAHVATVAAPVVMTWLLVRISGVALLDRTLAERKPAYRDYMARTSGFIPWPPRRQRQTRSMLAACLVLALGAPLLAGAEEPSQMQIGDTFPTLRGEYLTGRKATLPDDARGKAAVILMGFTYASRKPVEAWADRLKPALADIEGTTFYEVPVIGGMARMGKWFIDSGMRRGTPKALHEQVITVWGDTRAWKARAGVTGDRDQLAYVTLIDADGRIRWRVTGVFDEAAFQALLTELRALTRPN